MVALRVLMGSMACLISRAEVDVPGGPGGQVFPPGSVPSGSGGQGGSPGFGGQPSGFGGPGGPGFGGQPSGYPGGSDGSPGFGGQPSGFGGPGGAGVGGQPSGYPGGSDGSPGFGGQPSGFGGPGGPGVGGQPSGYPGGSEGSPGFGGQPSGFGGPGGPGLGGQGFDGPGGPGGPGFADGSPGFDSPDGSGSFGGPPPGGSCPDCNFNASVLEAFTQDFNFVSIEGSLYNTTTSTLRHATGHHLEAHGTIALDVRHMQSQLTMHEASHSDGDHPHQTVDWNILVNGVSRQASLHLSSTRLNACISVNLPVIHAPRDEQLQMIDTIAPMMVRQTGHPGTLDGDDIIVLSQPLPPFETPDTYAGGAVDINNQSSHLALIRFPQSQQVNNALASEAHHTITTLGVKFSNYRASTNFVDVGCTIAAQVAAQELLSDPEARAHFEGRLRQLEQHAVALRSIAPVAHVFAAVPTNLVDIFLPESSARSDIDMIEKVHSNSNIHSWTFGALILGLTATVGGVLLHKASRGEEESDMYENLEA